MTNGWGKDARILYFNDRIYVRSFEDKSKPFHVIHPDTLEIDKDFPEVKLNTEEGVCNIGFQEEPDKEGRTLKQSPFFTDGTYFYVVAQKKEAQDQEEGESGYRLMVEVYNPNKNYEFVRSITLFKN